MSNDIDNDAIDEISGEWCCSVFNSSISVQMMPRLKLVKDGEQDRKLRINSESKLKKSIGIQQNYCSIGIIVNPLHYTRNEWFHCLMNNPLFGET